MDFGEILAVATAKDHHFHFDGFHIMWRRKLWRKRVPSHGRSKGYEAYGSRQVKECLPSPNHQYDPVSCKHVRIIPQKSQGTDESTFGGVLTTSREQVSVAYVWRVQFIVNWIVVYGPYSLFLRF